MKNFFFLLTLYFKKAKLSACLFLFAKSNKKMMLKKKICLAHKKAAHQKQYDNAYHHNEARYLSYKHPLDAMQSR